MITFCPHCGHELQRGLVNGLGSCRNCSRVFDSSPYHRLLNGLWLARRKGIECPEWLMNYGFNEEEAALVIFAIENYLSHEDFAKLLDARGVSHNFCIEQSA